jgi:hypothetical protein
MYIDAHGIKKENVILVSIRNTDTSLINANCIYLRQTFLNRLAIKFLKYSPLSIFLIKELTKINKKFILYASWAYHESISTPSVEKLLSMDLCHGHFYIEEGQASYKPLESFDPNETSRDKTENIVNSKDLYRNDSIGYIGICSDVFPMAPIEKRIVLDNFKDLKKTYAPKLLGINNIGLTCAQRRLHDDEWGLMIKKIIEKMPNGGVIKLHPSFVANKIIQNKIESIFHKLAPASISLCSNNTILEIEMMLETKTLIGPLTSLNKYAEQFGSKFISIDLY